jgi:hypothetical protein
MNMKKAWIYLLLTSIGILFIGFWVYSISKRASETNEGSTFQSSMKNLDKTQPQNPTDLLTYSNNRLGISFQYPQRLGQVEFETYSGETGESFRGHFSSGLLDFGGISSNYSAGKESGRFDFQGYQAGYSKADRYYSEDGELIFPTRCEAFIAEVKSVNTIGVLVKALTPPETEGYYPCDVMDYGGLFNLRSSVFPGIIFWDNDATRLTEHEFKGILSTIEIW